MKKYIILLLLFLIINTSVYAVSVKDTLSSIENGVFGYDYNNDTETSRIERLEEYMYGQKKSGEIKNRLDSLQNDSGIVIVDEKKKNKKVQPVQNQDNYSNMAETPEQPPRANLKEDDTVEYAIVDKMESEVFNQTYKNENIYDRLNRLETKVFQKTSNADLSSRVDKLASVLRPTGHKMPMFSEDTAVPNAFNSEFQHIDNQSLPFQLAVLENNILRHEYIGDNNASRLSRLEQKLFNKTFQNDSDTTRLQRVAAAYEAKKDSYKYENNRRMQNIATMSQIGGILLMILAILL